MKTLHSALIVGLAAFTLSGCDTTRTVMTEAATAAFQDRTAEDQITDTKIKAGIAERLYGLDKMLVLDISSDVWEQNVMLTGTVTSASTRDKIAVLTRKDERIKALHNHIRVVSKAEQDERLQAAENALSDTWIETKIKAVLVATKDVRSINLRWRSVLGTVSIIGEAGTTAERDIILREIRAIDGVKAVNNHILIRKR